MVQMTTPPGDIGMVAPNFSLRGTDGQLHELGGCMGQNGLLVMFICNHCPFVLAVIERAVEVAKDVQSLGINTVAIMPNDTTAYPDDSFEHMQEFAKTHNFSFPYLIDDTQAVAKAYGAVCTPDFFAFDAAGQLYYRGRIDAGRMQPPKPEDPRELFEALCAMAELKSVPKVQHPSMGCSIKWREAA